MEKLIDKAIEILTGHFKNGMSHDDALKFSQAVLNLAHAKSTLVDVRKRE